MKTRISVSTLGIAIDQYITSCCGLESIEQYRLIKLLVESKINHLVETCFSLNNRVKHVDRCVIQ